MLVELAPRMTSVLAERPDLADQRQLLYGEAHLQLEF